MFTVSVRGDDRVARGLRTLAATVRDLSEAWQTIGAEMLDRSRPLVPVLSGQLVDALTVNVSGEGVTLLDGVEYAGVINYGSAARNIAAARFMDPAEEYAEHDAAHEVESLLTATARRVGLT